MASATRRQQQQQQRCMSSDPLPSISPATFYYSLTNIIDTDLFSDDSPVCKKQKRTLSKLDVGYASDDDDHHQHHSLFAKKCMTKEICSSSIGPPLTSMKRSQSDYIIGQQTSTPSPAHSLPLFEQNGLPPGWWRHSITSAYDTCSNPDIDISVEETKKTAAATTITTTTSLLMYSKKYSTIKRPSNNLVQLSSPEHQSLSSSSAVALQDKQLQLVQMPNQTSNSYDASAEYTDPEQSENDVDVSSSDFASPSSSTSHYPNSESHFYNRYTTTTGYSSDVELETTTAPSEAEEPLSTIGHSGEVSQMKIDTLGSSPSAVLDEVEQLNTSTINEKTEGSEPCWDGYQNPLFYSLNSHDVDSIETTLKWEDQFLEMDQPADNSSSDNDNDNLHRLLRNIDGSSSSLTAGGVGLITSKQILDSDSDLDDFNYVLNETERQLIKARQSLDKRKREQPSTIINDRNLRKYDEVLRTCETNIQCLQQILKNLHRSKNSRLNSSRAIEQLQGFLVGWHDMRDQVNDNRARARHLLHISQEIIKLKLRLDDELVRFETFHIHPWSKESSLNELIRIIHYEIETTRDNRQKLASYRADINQTEEHLDEYRMTHPSGSSSANVYEHIHGSRLALEQLADKMDSYQAQLRTLSTMIDNLAPVEIHIEQKFAAVDYNNNQQVELQELHTLIDAYERMMPTIHSTLVPINNLHSKLQNHCETKVDIYRKMLNDLQRRQQQQTKHVSFSGSGSINLNNNNSSTIMSTTTSSSAGSTPQQYQMDETFRSTKTKRPSSASSINRQQRRTETRTVETNEIDHEYTPSSATTLPSKQSTTSSYISDDCKVLYIETVIEVAKPVFYERTTDTSASRVITTNTEQQQQQQHHHHHHHHPRTQQIASSTQRPLTSRFETSSSTSKKTRMNESSDDETTNLRSTTTANNPVHSSSSSSASSTSSDHHLVSSPLTPVTTTRQQQLDSGIDLDHTSAPSSSSSTTFNITRQRTTTNGTKRLLFPPAPSSTIVADNTAPSALIRRLQQTPSAIDNVRLNNAPRRFIPPPIVPDIRGETYIERFRQLWLRSLILGLLILLIFLTLYFSRLDSCSRTTIIRSFVRKIICVEHEGLPTI